MAFETPEKMPSPSATHQKFPGWLRWTALVWLIFWFVVYWRTWGAANFLHLCDISMILICIGVWTNNSLLLSSQAVSSLLVDTAWSLDAAYTFLFGRHLTGGTEYVFDAKYPLWIRLLSLFHVLLPPFLIWAVRRQGYDRRGWALQCMIASLAFIAARFTSPADNINFAFREPFFQHAWSPAALHLAFTILFMSLVVYLPTHLVLRAAFPPPKAA